MSRPFSLLPLCLLAALLCLAAPARAGISILSITGVPNPIPAAGAFAPVLIDCGGTTGTPTGSATLTGSSGAIVSQNNVAWDQADTNGNPIVYAYVVFPVNHAAGGTTYTLVITVTGSDGTTDSRAMTLVQGLKAPITINSVTASPSPLPAAGSSVTVQADLTDSGANQAPYQSGFAQVMDSGGAILDIQSFQGAPTPGSDGDKTYSATLGNIPANMGVSTLTYTVTVGVKDNTGVWSYATTPLTQLGAGIPAPAATSLSVPTLSGTLGQPVTLSATLSTTASVLAGRSVSFSVDSAAVGASVTDGTGLASVSYALPSSLSAGSHTLTASFAGDSGDLACSETATLTVGNPVTPTTPLSLLWTCLNGQASLWRVGSSGNFSHQEYGPYAGWTALALSSAPGGAAHLLWTNTSGEISLWNVDAANNFTHAEFGPFAGWSAASLSTGADGATHLLWNRTDGLVSLWNLDTTSGGFTHAEYGPYAGWNALAVASGPTSTDLLWTSASGMASSWVIGTSGSIVYHEYGPFSGWTAAAFSVGPDGGAHLWWNNVGGQTSLWSADFGTGSFTHAEFSPLGGWTGRSVTTGADNTTHLLWNNVNGTQSLWNIAVNGTYTHLECGPFPGWTAVAVSAEP